MEPSSRLAIVLWSALPGLVVGVLAGGALWVAAQLLRYVIPGVDASAARWQTPLAVVCFVVLPTAAVVAGALEGWLKQR